jgi:hypothetical protein
MELKGDEMTKRTSAGLDEKRLLTNEMIRTIANALDKLPGEYQLPLWLSCEVGADREDFNGMFPVSGTVLNALKDKAMCKLLGELREKGILTDELSVMALMRAMVTYPAPASLIRRIGIIAGMPIDQRHAARTERLYGGAPGECLRDGKLNTRFRSQRQDP